MEISENFLFFIWQYRLFNNLDLKCVDGRPLQILNPGRLNKNAGPDFTEAKLIIDQIFWAGDVEIHVKGSDWELHNHHQNPAYEAVVLHVVYNNDKIISQQAGQAIPTLVIKERFNEGLLVNYSTLLNGLNSFPCKSQIGKIESLIVSNFLSRLLIERLEQKSEEVITALKERKGDWNETFYFFLARNFGFKVNAAAFEMLAMNLPKQILQKHSDKPLEVEALLFGQAGFLHDQMEGEYPVQLWLAYRFLKRKYSLNPIPVSVWKFLRMRPVSFPTIRLAQFAALQIHSRDFFSAILHATTWKELLVHIEDLPVNTYWTTHYHFKKDADDVPLQLGKKTVENILINTVCVFLFTYGRYTSNDAMVERSLGFLEQIPQENNSIVNQYVEAGLVVNNAFNSQAILQLNKYYCAQKKCLNCGIGIKILKK
ncbi:hypothetical protein ACVWYN_001172 [Pedobacter sp. UYP24]